MKKLILMTLVALMSLPVFAQDKWTVDPMHSFVNFAVKRSAISFVDGSFRKFNGEFTASKADFSDAQINFTVDVASIYTSVDMRDNHLRSADFFDAEKYPQMSFVSTSFQKVKGNKYRLKGKLTLKDVTKDVVFDVVYGGQVTDNGTQRAGFMATTKINRLDYHVAYDSAAAVIAKDVHITLNLQFLKAK